MEDDGGRTQRHLRPFSLMYHMYTMAFTMNARVTDLITDKVLYGLYGY